MCGIIGVVSTQPVAKKLLDGLHKLEYRGYDSVGLSTIDNNSFTIKKDIGKVSQVDKKCSFAKTKGNIGIAHCRWSTHGGVTKNNAHPHQAGDIVLIHNGIIENYEVLRDELRKNGCRFVSQTDTEVLAHLINQYHQTKPLRQSVELALNRIHGSYAIGVLSTKEPNTIIASKNESPLIIGIGKNENYIASDVPAIIEHTKKVVYLHDKELAVLTAQNVEFYHQGKNIKKTPQTIQWTTQTAQKAGYAHFMLKEIFEQPKAITETIQSRLSTSSVQFKNELKLSPRDVQRIDRIIILACGTSWHAALTGEFMLEELAKVPVEVEYASEFRYRNPLLSKNSLVIAISQSGETADTNAALKEAKKRGAKTLAICNVVGSTMTRIADGVVYTKAGPEIGVASTKAFVTQLVVLYLITILFAQERKSLNKKQLQDMVTGLRKLPLHIQAVLEEDHEILHCVKKYWNKANALYLGRGVNFPIALEGALKLKEVSYIHAEGYPAAEMKHGPIALIDKNMPVVVIAPKDVYTYKKILGNIEEVKARGGKVIAIATEGDTLIGKKADHTIYIPRTLYTLSSIVATIPLQLLAYHIAVKRKLDPDKPRNLAKACTVE